ncbi:MAG: DUF362 domain-containing protein [Pirellulaceae bacterium]
MATDTTQPQDSEGNSPGTPQQGVDRRALLVGGSLIAAGLFGSSLVRDLWRTRSSVFIARGQRYDGSLVRTIRDGLIATGLDAASLSRKSVLLKPNLVEPTREAPHMTTHPAIVLATAAVFRGWGARVVIGEAPGHMRDTGWALVESGLQDAIDSEQLEFADLNYEAVQWAKNLGRRSPLPGFFFPRAVASADLVVSLPKLKTHHWVGATVSLKNMYGTLPGVEYGWPKNVLHHAGIPETVYDINASLPKTVAVVDAIDCMEGDGPIMGTRKHMGLVLVGTNPTAVDATACRLMQLDPSRISYLQLAAGSLGPIDERLIDQRGEDWQSLASPFEILNEPHLRRLRLKKGTC